MNEWIKVRNDAYQAVSQAKDRSRELRERFKNTKQKIYQLNTIMARVASTKERALVAYSTNPHSVQLQEELTTARENMARTRQELADMEALMEASKGEYRFLRKEIPVLQQAYADAEKLFWFGVFEKMQKRIRQAIGSEVEGAYAAYSATFASDLSYDMFLQRLFPNTAESQRNAEIRKEMAQEFPLKASEPETKTYSLAPPTNSGQEGGLTPSEEARQWAHLVRG